MRVLVTGGAGFIGSNFVEMALTDQFPAISSVIVLDKLTYAGKLSNLSGVANNPSFEFVQGDICDVDIVNGLAADVDAIINFAAESHVDRSIKDSSRFTQTNILGTQVLLDAAKNHNVAKFVQISTDEVYGSIIDGSWDENAPLLPNSPYSASKAAADLLVRSYHQTHGLNICITRCSNNFGPRQDSEKLIPNFINRILQGLSLPLYGTGRNVRDWVYVDDHCRGIYLVLMAGLPNQIYNIGGSHEMSNLELTKMLISGMGGDLRQIMFVEDRLGHDFRYSVDFSKIKKFGYKPSDNFQINLINTINWYKNQR